MLLRSDGSAPEQLLSPLVITTSPVHAELIALAPDCLTRHHADHYRGFAGSQWRLFERTGQLKPLLYTLRVLLTGIHLMRTGDVEADLGVLWAQREADSVAGLSYVPELIAAKCSGEHAKLDGIVDVATAGLDVVRLHARLDEAAAASHLPERANAEAALHDLVVRVRLGRL